MEIFSKTIAGAGIEFKELVTNDVFDIGHYHLNHESIDVEMSFPTYETMKNGKVIKAQKTLREKMLSSEIEPNKDHVVIGDKYVSVLSIDVLGSSTEFDFYEQLKDLLPEDHEYLVSVERIENVDLFKLHKKNRDNASTTNLVNKKMKRDNPDKIVDSPVKTKRAILQDGENYAEDVEALNLRSFKFSIMFTIKCDSYNELREKVKEIKETLLQNKFYNTHVSEEFKMIIDNYHAFIPGNTHQITDFIYNNSLSVINNLKFHEEYKGYDVFDDSSPTNQIYMGRMNEVIKYHTYWIPGANFRHGESTGSTGSGKTMDMNKTSLGIIEEKIDDGKKPIMMLVEPKNGFTTFTNYKNGVEIKYDMTSNLSYNPFFKKKDMTVLIEEDRSANVKYEPLLMTYYANLIEQISKDNEHPSLPARSRNMVLDIFTELYDKNDDEWLPILNDVRALFKARMKGLEGDEKAEVKRIIDNISLFCRPEYENMFNKREELDIDNDILYFNLGLLEDDKQLKETAWFIMAAQIMKKLRVPGRVKYLRIDEASVVYKTKIGADMIEFFLRLARSLGGVIDLASQNVDDASNSEAHSTIANNLAIQTCLYLKSGHEYLKDVGYSAEEEKIIRSLVKKPGEYIEIYRKINGKKMILKSIPDPYLYWLSTNDDDDSDIFRKYEEKYKGETLGDIIIRLAEDYPNGHYTKK